MSVDVHLTAPSGPWHVRGVVLPDGDRSCDWWIVDGHLTDELVAGASDLPGAWVLPGGLVDAHTHLTMNFGHAMPHADGSDDLIAANGAAQLRAGVLALRDAGHAWGGVPRECPDGPRLQRAGSLIAPPGRGYPNVRSSIAFATSCRMPRRAVCPCWPAPTRSRWAPSGANCSTWASSD